MSRFTTSPQSDDMDIDTEYNDDIDDLEDVLSARPNKRAKRGNIKSKKPNNNNNNTTAPGKRQVKDFFGVDSSKIHQTIPSFTDVKDYEPLDKPRTKKRVNEDEGSSDEEVQVIEEDPADKHVVHPLPAPSADATTEIALSAEVLESRLDVLRWIIDGDDSDSGLYSTFVQPKDPEEVIKAAYLDESEYQLTPAGSVDYTTIKAKAQLALPQGGGTVSVGEGALNSNEPNYNIADPLQYICSKHAENLRLFLRAQKLFLMLNFYKYKTEEVQYLFDKWQRARFACQQTFELVRSHIMWNRCKWETFNPNRYMKAVDFYLERMSFHIGETRETINKMKKRGAAEISSYISIHLQMDDLRRNPSGTILYQQLMQSNGKPTFTWHPYKTLAQYVIDKCCTDAQLYGTLMESPMALSSVLGILAPDGTKGANAPEHPCLPIVRMNRYLFAYRNGLYDVKANKFYDNPASCPQQNLTACRFFDSDFKTEWLNDEFDWRNIPTPFIDSIMDHQEFRAQGVKAQEEALSRAGKSPTNSKIVGKDKQGSDKVDKEAFKKSSAASKAKMSKNQQAMYKRIEGWKKDPHSLPDWIYAFGGRLLYNQAEADKWEKMFFLLGWAGTGKSTFGQVFSAFYPAEKIAIIGNRTEVTFGLEALESSFMNIAFDINNNFTFDICDWKSIVSGEPVQIKKKNKVAVTAKLQGSWLVICNILPNWSDEQGSLTRRMALLRFTKPVPQDKTDTNLLNRIINEELPLLLVKCNRAYREKLVQVGDEDVRKHWSYYFDKSTQEIDNECNAFEAFLKSDQVVIPSKTEDEQRYNNTYVLDSELKREFVIFCRRQKFGLIPWNSEEVEPKLSNGRDILRFESVKLPNRKVEENVTIDWDDNKKKSQAPNAERLVYWRGIDVVRLLSKTEANYYRQRSQENNQPSIQQPSEQVPVQSLIS